jgi:predicted transcriptional regulator
MSDIRSNESQNFAEMTSDLVAAYVAHNPLPLDQLPTLIQSVHSTLSGLNSPRKAEAEKPAPAVPIRKSITPDYIISLEDGRKFKSLKRSLGKLGMTPAEYRTKWGLPPDYPMVAPNYAAQRSELAKSLGLGQQRRKNTRVKTAKANRGTNGR